MSDDDRLFQLLSEAIPAYQPDPFTLGLKATEGMAGSYQLSAADVRAAMEAMRNQTYEPHRLPPMHPADYAYIQRDLGTTEPLTEQQVIEWAWDHIFKETDEPV